MKKQLLLSFLCLFAWSFTKAQLRPTTSPPILYPALEVSPEMEQAKSQAVYRPELNNTTANRTPPDCHFLTPICTAPGAYYSLTTSANSPSAHTLNPNNNYACLGTTPNPMWYYIRVGNSGDILLNLNAQSDIDYIIWGPFPSVAVAEQICGNYTQVTSCSYSASNNEFPQILGAQSGQIYVFLITNFANIVQTATLTQVGGTGTMSCDELNSINGRVIKDANSNCQIDTLERGMRGIYVNSTRGFAVTDSMGRYSIIADSGSYTVTQVIPNYLRPLVNPICDTSHNIYFNGAVVVDTMGINFYNEVLDCPLLTVDIMSNRRRRCFRNSTTVRYCNEGFRDTSGVQVFVEFPQYVHFISANMPHTINSNGVYVFNVGNLAAGQCGTINIIDSVACVPNIMGLTQCTQAWITPANSCVASQDTTTGWDRSSVRVTGTCVGDSIAQFTITNTGSSSNGNMTAPSEYRIYINGLLVYTGTFQLAGGASLVVNVPATGGVIRLEADQRPGHPGNSRPNAVVQGCGDTSQTPNLNDWLAYNAQASNDGDVTIEEDCQPILDSYDPNDKQVSPSGVGVEHYVQPNTSLDYTIRFQNTGNALAYRVIVRDTLPSYLDIGSLRLGTSSHRYDFQITGSGQQTILVFDFKNINLPDSASNPLGSQGYLKFKMAPRSSTPMGTVVSNKAAIYFDFNDPIITNSAWVTIHDTVPTGNPIVVTVISATQNTAETISWSPLVFPNPTTGQLTLDLERASVDATISLYNMQGQLLTQTANHQERFVSMDLAQLPAGVYLLQLRSELGSQLLKVVKR